MVWRAGSAQATVGGEAVVHVRVQLLRLLVVPVHQEAELVEPVHHFYRRVEVDVEGLLLASQLLVHPQHFRSELLEQVFELRLFLQRDRLERVAAVLLSSELRTAG